MTKIVLLCMSVWIVPFITATTAVAMNKMEFVTGNWCWIAAEPFILRYLLGHMWRMAIFVVVIVLYIIIFMRVRRRLRARTDSQEHRYSIRNNEGQYTEAHTTLRHAHDDIIMGTTSRSSTGGFDYDDGTYGHASQFRRFKALVLTHGQIPNT